MTSGSSWVNVGQIGRQITFLCSLSGTRGSLYLTLVSIPVEYLSITEATDFLGVTLLPTDDPRVPQTGQLFSLEEPVGCVAAIGVRGTNYRLKPTVVKPTAVRRRETFEPGQPRTVVGAGAARRLSPGLWCW